MREENASFIFISYAREDIAFVTRLKTDLSARGISSWIDLESLRPGTDDWEKELRKAIRSSSAILFAASPNAISSRHVKDELGIAAMYQRPIYPIWIHGDHWLEAAPIGTIQYIDARGEMYSQALSALIQELSTIRGTSSTEKTLLFPPKFSLPHQPRNLYKGLRAFQGKDFQDFFGRGHFTQQLIQSLHHLLKPEQQEKLLPRLVTVIGPSGSGKSSIIMAGLLPRLQQGALLESQNWIYLNPGEHPLEALTLALSSQFPARSLSSIREDLNDIRALHFLMTSLMKQKETRVVLFIDQFEELFTQTVSEAERKHFLDLLITAAAEPQGPAIILLTLRADFYDRPLQYLDLGQLIEDHHKAVLPMTLQELREVIEKSTQLPDVQMKFEDNLVGDILFDVQGQVGALPLLQFTLEQLFQYRDGRYLTNQAYQEIGGVKGALAKHAETTYTSLPSEDHRKLARALFLRLVDSGTIDQDATKRRIALDELILSNPTETAILETVWQTFTEKRLLMTNVIAGTSTLKLSHEALMKAWDRFTNWLQDAHEDIYFQGILRRDVTEWIRHNRNIERLHKGSQLIEAQEWRKRNIPSREEDEFLQASID